MSCLLISEERWRSTSWRKSSNSLTSSGTAMKSWTVVWVHSIPLLATTSKLLFMGSRTCFSEQISQSCNGSMHAADCISCWSIPCFGCSTAPIYSIVAVHWFSSRSSRPSCVVFSNSMLTSTNTQYDSEPPSPPPSSQQVQTRNMPKMMRLDTSWPFKL